jgi:hypothetical protein
MDRIREFFAWAIIFEHRAIWITVHDKACSQKYRNPMHFWSNRNDGFIPFSLSLTRKVYMTQDAIDSFQCDSTRFCWYSRSDWQDVSFVFLLTTVGLAKRVHARLLLASTSEVYGGTVLYSFTFNINLLSFIIIMAIKARRWLNDG